MAVDNSSTSSQPPGSVRVPPKADRSLIDLTKKYDIILGSSSKWRRTVLEASGCRCVDVISPDIDEKSIRGSTPLETTYKITKEKADAIMDRIGDKGWTGLLVCSDQVSVCDGECREKPETVEEARRFIRSYTDEGLPVSTISTMVVVDIETGRRAYGNHEATVRFAPIPPAVVDRLVEPCSPIYTCSGGFSIDDPIMGQYCTSVKGGVDAVMGMPLGLLEKLIVEVTSDTPAEWWEFFSRLPLLYSATSGSLLLRCRAGLEKILAGEVNALLAPLKKRNKGTGGTGGHVVIFNSGEVEFRSPTAEAVELLSQKCRVAQSISQRVAPTSSSSSSAYFPCTGLDDLIERLGTGPLSGVLRERKAFICRVTSGNSKLDGGPAVVQKLNAALALTTEVTNGAPVMIDVSDDMCSVEYVRRDQSTTRPWLDDSPPTGTEEEKPLRQPSWSTIGPGRGPPPRRRPSPPPYRGVIPAPTVAAAAVLKTSILSILSRTPANRAATEDVLVWDPFCGQGTLMLELASVVLGVPLSAATEVKATPYANAHRLQIIATDPLEENVTAARTNLGKSAEDELLSQAEASSSPARPPIGVEDSQLSLLSKGLYDIEKQIDLSVSRTSNGMSTLPFRNLSGGFATHQGIKMFQTFGHLVGSRNDWAGVYVLTDSKAFQTYSRLVWETQFEIQTSPDSKMRLLRWTGLRRGEAAATSSVKKSR
ncbi:hypothetical protein FOZ60_011209 [Perkinsus olseni]|uniref:Ribosomal RNA large subunit methyltransferase K/L-like methyltransferase domain-containing protein n=2 Tax=Perkinsus olseni TaxID=32597 RepID=A0A7J6NG93_PEROL|nr:hypothetical protein FOZ60_011209 [Perkinsus olseni]